MKEALLKETLEVLRELANHPAFEDDAPEFNEGGIGHEMCRKLQEQLGSPSALADGEDYVLEPATSCWVTVGSASVNIQHGSEGVGVTIYPLHQEMNDSVGETWVTWGELEPDEGNAGCDSCGTNDRADGSIYCTACFDEAAGRRLNG